MPSPLPGVSNSNYTPISTAGTTTLNPGQSAPAGQNLPPPIAPGAFYGVQQLTPGTNFAFTVVDILAGTATVTNTLLNGTGTANQQFPAGVPGVGMRYKGALVVITAGTPGAINALWD